MFIGQDLLRTTQGEHLVSLPFSSSPPLSPMLSLSLCFCLFLSFSLSVLLAPSPCLSTQYCLLFSFSLLFFLNPPLPFPPKFFSLLSCMVYFFWLSSLFLFFYYPFVSLLPPLPLSVFILYYFGTSLSVRQFKAVPSLWCSSLLCTWLSTRTSMHPPLPDG